MEWQGCKNILCVRPDNMGDLLMSGPAIGALKETFGCDITVLTSSTAKGVAKYLKAVDEILVWDVPWVKGDHPSEKEDFMNLVEILKEKNFDAAVIFTVFSQNPLPSALLLSLAGIPKRLAYCRENPYQLLTDWIPEKEPYTFIRHQVRRDLDLVKTIGATTKNDHISLQLGKSHEQSVLEKFSRAGIDIQKPWLIIHPGVSERKREYPMASWIEAGKRLVDELHYQIVITGNKAEQLRCDQVRVGIGHHAFNFAGSFTLEEFITAIRLSPLMISVNTGSIHLAAAVRTKTIVLYAMTNPQHSPWKTVGRVLPFPVAETLQSRNEVLQFVQQNCFREKVSMVTPEMIFQSAYDILINHEWQTIPELVSTGIEVA